MSSSGGSHGTGGSATGLGLARTHAKARSGQPLAVTFIGDSGLEGNTAGNPGVDDCASLVCTTLAARYGVAVTKHNRAVSGRTAALDELLDFPTALADAADVYVIGVSAHNDLRSDATFPGTGYPRAASMGAIERMVRRIRRTVPAADIIISGGWPYNPWTSDTTGSNQYVAAHSKLQRALAGAYGCEFVDLYEGIKALGVSSTYIDATNHPTSAGHAVWANLMLARFPAVGADAPAVLPPTVGDVGLYGPHRGDRRGWIEYTASRAYGTSGLPLPGSWAAATLPATTSTAGDAVRGTFVGTECMVRLDCGAGQGHVSILIDNALVYPDVDLSTYPAGQRYLPITGLGMGLHTVLVTLLSGSMTFRGLDVLMCAAEIIDPDSTRITYNGATWGATTATSATYNNKQKAASANGDGVTVDFVGTGVGVHVAAIASRQLSIAIDGAAPVNVVLGGVASPSGFAGVVLASGLDFGRHTAVIAAAVGNSFVFGSLFFFDETGTARTRRQSGIAKVGETVVYPVPYAARPALTLSAGDGTSTEPPGATTPTAAGFTVAGTAGGLVRWEAEGGLVRF